MGTFELLRLAIAAFGTVACITNAYTFQFSAKQWMTDGYLRACVAFNIVTQVGVVSLLWMLAVGP